jgi:hypothetical protein
MGTFVDPFARNVYYVNRACGCGSFTDVRVRYKKL